MKDFVGGAGGDRPGDRLRVQGLESRFVVFQWHDAAHGTWTGGSFSSQVFKPEGVTTRG